MTESRVGRTAYALGFAGLLPQIVAVGAFALLDPAHGPSLPAVVAAVYPLAILSFLGGMWWGLAMRGDAAQPAGVLLAVLPSLAAVALAFAFFVAADAGLTGWCFVATGSAILLTLLVDRWLERQTLTPDGWMRLRVPLSVGLGGLTILAGALVGVAQHGGLPT